MNMRETSLEDAAQRGAADAVDAARGNLLERAVFGHRVVAIVLCAIVTVVLGYFAATRLQLSASFERMIPHGQPFIKNFIEHRKDLRGLGNSLRVVVENPNGDIFDPRYLETLRKVSDELMLVPGVDRAWMKSLWLPSVRWTEVTEEGFQGGPVMPDAYNGSPDSVEQLKRNIRRANIVGSLVAGDMRSTMMFVPLLENDPATGKPIDLKKVSAALEDIRARHAVESPQHAAATIHIVGFAKVVGDLIDGLWRVMGFFAIAALIASLILLAYTRCARSTAIVISCSLVAVTWQLGLVALAGLDLDPYSILVPFLVFAIGVSHGAQKMNGIMQDIGRGTSRLTAARHTFRRLFMAGLAALVADVVGFAVLMAIDIPVIRELAAAASVGVAVLIVTNLLLIPVLLSYTGVSAKAAARSLAEDREESRGRGLDRAWRALDLFTERRPAIIAIATCVLLAAGGLVVGRHLAVGDLDPGAPELRTDSRYNRDNAYITSHYALSSDQFAVIVQTPPEGCLRYETLVEADRLAWRLRQVPGVQTTVSLADAVRNITAGSFEGNPKWLTLSRNQDILNYAAQQASVNNPDLFNTACSVMPVIAYLSDHKAKTLQDVVAAASDFSQDHNADGRTFKLAAGNSGIEAATNIVVERSNRTMLLFVYGAVAVLCFVTFRSWRAVVVALVPLAVTSILCEALMVALGIGVKVATLPVVALGVGIGVDYALYLLSVQLAHQRAGVPLAEAYRKALRFTGKVVALVGITLAAGVITWAFSPIKFQADMGILLTFMFLWNMAGALVLIPALSHFLLPTSVVAKDSKR
jgi:predicted RND superfamily exporter protein